MQKCQVLRCCPVRTGLRGCAATVSLCPFSPRPPGSIKKDARPGPVLRGRVRRAVSSGFIALASVVPRASQHPPACVRPGPAPQPFAYKTPARNAPVCNAVARYQNLRGAPRRVKGNETSRPLTRRSPAPIRAVSARRHDPRNRAKFHNVQTQPTVCRRAHRRATSATVQPRSGITAARRKRNSTASGCAVAVIPRGQ